MGIGGFRRLKVAAMALQSVTLDGPVELRELELLIAEQRIERNMVSPARGCGTGSTPFG